MTTHLIIYDTIPNLILHSAEWVGAADTVEVLYGLPHTLTWDSGLEFTLKVVTNVAQIQGYTCGITAVGEFSQEILDEVNIRNQIHES